MSWKQNNGRDRGHNDGIGDFLKGPLSARVGGTVDGTVSITGNKSISFAQTDTTGRMIVEGSSGALASDATLSAANTNLNMISLGVLSTNTKLDTATIKLDTTNTKLDTTNTKLDTATIKLEATNTKLDTTNTKLDTTNTKLEAINTTLNDIKNQGGTGSGGTGSVTIKGNQGTIFSQTNSGHMIVEGSTGGPLALDATLLATNTALGPTGTIDTTLNIINTALGPTGTIDTTLNIINTTLNTALGPTGTLVTKLDAIINAGGTGSGVTGSVFIQGDKSIKFAQTDNTGRMIVEDSTGPLALDATLATLGTKFDLLIWLLTPFIDTTKTAGTLIDTWRIPFGSNDPIPYHNTMIISGICNSTIVIYSYPYGTYDELGIITYGSPDTNRVIFTPEIKGLLNTTNPSTISEIVFGDGIRFTLEITIPDRYVKFDLGDTTNVRITLMRK